MKNNIEEINGWLYHRIRMCIWKQWKLPKNKEKKSDKDGSTRILYEYGGKLPEEGHWYCANLTTVKESHDKKRD